MMELLSCSLFLTPSVPLVAFRIDRGRCSMWTRQQTTAALRAVVALASGRAGGGIRVAFPGIWGHNSPVAGGAAPEVLQCEGRWVSDAYQAYGRSHWKDAGWVATVMTPEGLGNGIRPGQGTE